MVQNFKWHRLGPMRAKHVVKGAGVEREQVYADKWTEAATAGRGEEVRQVLVRVFILIILFSCSQHIFTAALLCRASLALP